MNFIKRIWLGLSDPTREHVVSAVRTFVSTFVVISASVIMATGIEHFSVAVAISALTAGVNAGLKALLAAYAPPTLGGRRK